ncbi:HNH endonuclease signature motif containing protein [Heyndrickxia faecalis]|uniref:HNH endonuclease signature motif containing protein n=1 Tax=Heyndrickxia faecalis TaxID=2824910 RepID=UPI0032B18D87
MRNIVVNGETIPYYFVDESGCIYTETKEPMKLHEMENGYLRVKLSRGVKRGMYLVHRIVAETFIDNPNSYPIVHHKDDNRKNNRVSNLEWCTNSYNQKKRFENGKHAGTKCKKVAQIDLRTNEILQIWESPIFANKELGIQRQNISKVCLGQRNQAGGYGWKYV